MELTRPPPPSIADGDIGMRDFHAWCVDKETGKVVDWETKDFYEDICMTHYKTKSYRLHYKAWDWETITEDIRTKIQEVKEYVCENIEVFKEEDLKDVGHCLLRAVVLYYSYPSKYEIKVGSLGISPNKSKKPKKKKSKKSNKIWWMYGNGDLDFNNIGCKAEMMIETAKEKLRESGIGWNAGMEKLFTSIAVRI